MNTVVLYLPYAPPSWQVWSVSLRVPLHPRLFTKRKRWTGPTAGGRRGARGSRLTPRAVGDGRTAVPLQAGLAREKAVGNVGAPRPSVTTDGTRAS